MSWSRSSAIEPVWSTRKYTSAELRKKLQIDLAGAGLARADLQEDRRVGGRERRIVRIRIERVRECRRSRGRRRRRTVHAGGVALTVEPGPASPPPPASGVIASVSPPPLAQATLVPASARPPSTGSRLSEMRKHATLQSLHCETGALTSISAVVDASGQRIAEDRFAARPRALAAVARAFVAHHAAVVAERLVEEARGRLACRLCTRSLRSASRSAGSPRARFGSWSSQSLPGRAVVAEAVACRGRRMRCSVAGALARGRTAGRRSPCRHPGSRPDRQSSTEILM